MYEKISPIINSVCNISDKSAKKIVDIANLLNYKKGELIKETDDQVISWWVLPQGSLPHLGYAITWFGLMLTSLFFSVVSLRNNNPPRRGSDK